MDYIYAQTGLRNSVAPASVQLYFGNVKCLATNGGWKVWRYKQSTTIVSWEGEMYSVLTWS